MVRPLWFYVPVLSYFLVQKLQNNNDNEENTAVIAIIIPINMYGLYTGLKKLSNGIYKHNPKGITNSNIYCITFGNIGNGYLLYIDTL